MLRVMRLWADGMATPVYSGISLGRALWWLDQLKTDRRYWIEDDRQPSVALGQDWRRQDA